MKPVVFFVRADVRHRWRALLWLSLLVAVAGTTILAAAAGARRTDTAYPRFLQASHASDVVVSPAGTGLTGYYSALGQVRGVTELGREAGITAFVVDARGRPRIAGPPLVYFAADRNTAMTIDRPKILAGRLPRYGSAAEVVVDEAAATAFAVHPGSELDLLVPGIGPDGQPDPSNGVRLRERVVGIVVQRTGVVRVTALDAGPKILATPALLHRILPTIGGPTNLAFDAAVVRLGPNVRPSDFGRATQALAKRFPDTHGQVYLAYERDQVAAVQRAIRPEVLALALFAILTAVIALVVLGQAASRLLTAGSRGYGPLRALGMTRSQLTAVGLVEVAMAGAVGAIVSVSLAIGLSPLTPIGPARLAEPHPGVEVNTSVLGIGLVAIVALLVAAAARPAWRTAGRGPSVHVVSAARSSRLERFGAVMPLTASLGIRMAANRDPRSGGMPVAGGVGAVAIAVASVVTALMFGVNMSRLVTTPHLYGRTWDVMVDQQSGFGAVSRHDAEAWLAGQRPVAWSLGDHGIIQIDGQQVSAVGIDRGSGTLLAPTILEGRAPRTASEIALGSSTLRRTGHRVGDLVVVSTNGRKMQMRIVGRAVFPAFSQGTFAPTNLGEGALTTAAPLSTDQSHPVYSFVMARFADSPAKDAEVSRLVSAFTSSSGGLMGCRTEACGVFTQQLPTDIVDYTHVEAMPLVLAGVLGLLAAGILLQLLVLSTNAHRRDLAVLRGFGLHRRQVMAVVAWEAVLIAAAASIIGVPLGVAAGRWIWRAFAEAAGVGESTVTPILVLALLVAGTIFLALATAAVPAWRAGRVPPASALRTDE